MKQAGYIQFKKKSGKILCRHFKNSMVLLRNHDRLHHFPDLTDNKSFHNLMWKVTTPRMLSIYYTIIILTLIVAMNLPLGMHVNAR